MPRLRHPRPLASPPAPGSDAATTRLAHLDPPVAIRLADATLVEALDSLLDPMVLLRPVRDERRRVIDFEYVDANEAAVRYMDTTRGQLLGSRLKHRELAHESDLFARHLRVYETGEPLTLTDFAYPNLTTGIPERYDIRETKVGDVLCVTWRDVTDREDLLDHYRLLAENASDVVFRVTAQFVVDWISPSIRELQGFTPEELVGQPLSNYCDPDDLADLLRLVAETPDDAKGEMEIRILKSDGTYRWCSLIGRRISDAGTVLGYIGSLRDIDAEHGQRAAQRESDARYRLLAENTSDVVMVSHAGGEIQWVSSAVTSLVGWRPSDMVGHRFAEFVHADDQTLMNEVRDRLDHGEVGRLTVRLRTVEGGYHWISVRVRDVEDPETGERQRVASWRDAEGEVASREALRESLSRFRLLAENASDVVAQLDADLTFRWVSPSCEQVVGWTPSSLVGHPATDLLLPEDPRVLEPLSPAANAVRTGRLRFRLPNGTYLWMSARFRTTFDERAHPSGQVVALRDIAAEVEARETLIASESRFRLLAENASDIVLETDADTRIRWVSPALPRVLGWSTEQWLGHDPLEFVHEDDLAKVRAHRAAAMGGERNTPLEARFRDAEGAAHWMSGLDHLVRNRHGEVVTRVIGLRNIDAEMAALESMAHAEGQYQMLAENASDIVLRIDNDSRITYVSPSVKEVLGWDPGELLGTTTWPFLFAGDLERVRTLRAKFFEGEHVDAFEIRAETRARDLRWLSMRPRAIRDATGAITSTVMAIRDVQSEVLTRRALTTLTACSRALIRAEDEARLLQDMCEIASGEGGYAFAWYARKVDDDDRSVLNLASSEVGRDYLEQIRVTWNEGPLGQGPAGRAIREERTIVIPDFRRDHRFTPWLQAADEHDFRAAVALPVRVGAEVDGAFMVYASEVEAFDPSAVSVLEDLAGELGFGLHRLREQVQLLESLSTRKLLTSAIEQAAESVLILDPSFTIIYANKSTERTSGYALEEIVGRKPMMFGDGRSSPERLNSSTLALSRGEVWTGTFNNRRKGGELYEEDATISPIHDEDGRLIAYVEVKNDRSEERRLQSDLLRTLTDQSSFTDVMKSMRAAETVHSTAFLFCEATIQLPDVDVAAVLLIQEDDLLPISVSGSYVFAVPRERVVPIGDPAFFARLTKGPLTVTMDPKDWPRNPDIAATLKEEGVVAMVMAPIRWDGALIGALALATKNPDATRMPASRLAFYEEVATYAGTLLGPQAHTFETRSVIQTQIRDVIDHERFTPHFQPFVDLRTGSVVGYEALTRFDDGMRPDEKIFEAWSVGVGMELEVALAAAALRDAAALPPSLFVSLNFSPDTLTEGLVAQVVEGETRPVVIEVTEHHPIEAYGEIIDAVERLPGCSLAVDDAGTGFMSLGKILELDPTYVKLDISLVRDIDVNAARQAMVAGMCHFAQQSRTPKIVVAEGVETEREADMVRDLGTGLAAGHLLAQGFHFGRPAPIEAIAGTS